MVVKLVILQFISYLVKLCNRVLMMKYRYFDYYAYLLYLVHILCIYNFKNTLNWFMLFIFHYIHIYFKLVAYVASIYLWRLTNCSWWPFGDNCTFKSKVSLIDICDYIMRFALSFTI